MSDLFQDGISDEFIERVWDIMQSAHWHVYQILTKRPERMLDVVTRLDLPWLENVWLGTSVESAKYAHRIDTLRQVPAAVRFISFEPLIGSIGRVDLTDIDWAIVGGESGPGARPMDVDWIDDIKISSDAHGTVFFFKQWGGTNKKATGRTYLGKTWDEYPIARRA
jgi:protein gp37